MCLLSVLEPPAHPCVAEKGMLAKLRSSAVSLLNAFSPQTVLLDQAQENLFMQTFSHFYFFNPSSLQENAAQGNSV